MAARFGRLGTARGPLAPSEVSRPCAGQLFAQALPAVLEFTSPRAWAFSLLGIHEYLRRLSGDRPATRHPRESLTGAIDGASSTKPPRPDWPWFEDELTYDNAKLPHALIVSGRADRCKTCVYRSGLQSLRWLVEVQTSQRGHFRPIGSNGFYRRAAHARTSTNNPSKRTPWFPPAWKLIAPHPTPGGTSRRRRAFDWFLGWNDLGLELYCAEHRRLPRWLARGPRQRKPGRRIDAGFSALAGRNAADAKYRHRFHDSLWYAPNHSMQTNRRKASRTVILATPTARRVWFGRSVLIERQRASNICARVMALSENAGRMLCWTSVRAEFGGSAAQDSDLLPAAFRACSPPSSTAKSCPKKGSCCSARISLTSIRWKPRPCSIPRSFRIPTNRICRRVRCVSSSACGPRAKATFPPSPFARGFLDRERPHHD